MLCFISVQGGNVGWVSQGDEFLDDVLPATAREAALLKKPGDIALVETDRGWHLVCMRAREYVHARARTKVRKYQKVRVDSTKCVCERQSVQESARRKSESVWMCVYAGASWLTCVYARE